jgi:hypothetical protein
MKKLEITYIGHRGMAGHENLYPEKHWLDYPPGVGLFSTMIKGVRETGFRKTYSSGIEVYIPPSAIIEMKEIEDGKSS